VLACVPSVGELNIKLNKALAVEASSEVREAVNGLTSNAARRLMELSTTTRKSCYFTPDDPDFRQLERRKLITISPDPEEEARYHEGRSDRPKCYSVAATKLGLETQTFLLNVLATTLTLSTN